MMLSNKSFFNKAVLRKDMTRFLPVWLVFIIMTVLNLTDITVLLFGGAVETIAYGFQSGTSTNFIFALISAGCLFGDLFNRRLCNAVHALPVRRETWYATHMVAGFLFWIGATVLKALGYMLVLKENWYLGLLWLGAMTVEYLFFLSLAAVCALCAGTKAGMTAMYLLVNFASMLVYALVSGIYQPLLPGIQIADGWAEFLSPLVFLSDADFIKVRIEQPGFEMDYTVIYEGLGSAWWYLLGLGVLTVGLVALGIFVYRKRKLESAGEFVVFRPLRQVLWALVAVAIGMVIQSVGTLSGTHSISLVIGLVIGGMLSEMLVSKSGKTALKGLAKGAVLAGIVGVTLVVVSMDPMGLVRWVPNADQVKSVVISDDLYFDEDEPEYYHYQKLTDTDSIQRVLDAHTLLTEEGLTEYHMDGLYSTYEYNQIYIKYYMSDGSQVVRQYYYEETPELKKALNPLWINAQFVLGYQDWDTFLEVNYTLNVMSTYVDEYLDEQQSRELLTAIKTDCDQGTWDNSCLWENDGYCTIGLVNGDWIDVSAGCTNTVQWLRENLPKVFE